MRPFSTRKWWRPLIIGGVLLLLLSDTAMASEGGQDWRPIYDSVMRWVNFAILFLVLYKFGKRPILDFLRAQKDVIEQEFTKLEAQKDTTKAKVREAMAALEESKMRLPELKTRLIEQGERRRQELIDEARDQGVLIMEGARHKIEYQIMRARNKMTLELLDMAMDVTLEKLPRIISEEDKERQVEKYLAIAGS